LFVIRWGDLIPSRLSVLEDHTQCELEGSRTAKTEDGRGAIGRLQEPQGTDLRGSTSRAGAVAGRRQDFLRVVPDEVSHVEQVEHLADPLDRTFSFILTDFDTRISCEIFESPKRTEPSSGSVASDGMVLP
jgi:hypothetical protein